MSEWYYWQQQYAKLILIGGFSLIMLCLLIVFAMFIFGMKRRANIEKVKKWFWNEPRPNGKHVNHGNGKL